MIGNGDDVMVWIHDLKYLGGRSFEVPPRMSNDNHRVIPLATATALLSLPMVSWMTKSVDNVLKWTLKADAIKDPSSSTVLMSGNPTQVFMEGEHAPLHQADREKAPMRSQGMFPVGTIVQRRLRAPMVHVDGRCGRAAWS